MNNKSLWISLSLVNLCIVALYGFILRSKILFPLHFLDYRNFLSAHSHFAFSGWVGLCLFTLFIYNLLPPQLGQRKVYQWILAGIELSSLGMAFTFPFQGYTTISIFFSSLYIFVNFFFAWVFIKDMMSSQVHKTIKLLSISAIASLIVSSIGPLGLVYILITKSGDSILYRDSIYTFLHFQYNGFFTLSVFALFFDRLLKKGFPGRNMQIFSILLCLSIPPTLFLSLLWHNKSLFYVFAAIGSILILASLYFFAGILKGWKSKNLFIHKLGRVLWLLSIAAFIGKMLMNVGTIIPSLGDAVYGDRPVIIGFLHLVFLGFITFYILSDLIEAGYFDRNHKLVSIPFYIFSAGIISTEALLLLQGLGILFKTNSYMYTWLLWIAAFLLFAGAVSIATTKLILNDAEIKMPPVRTDGIQQV